MEMAQAVGTEPVGEETPQEPEAQAAEEAGRKKGKPKLLLIVAAVVLLGGGGFAAKKFVLSGHEKGEKGAKEPKAAKAELHEPGPILDLGEEFVVNLDGGGYARAKVALELGIELKGGHGSDAGAEFMAPLRDVVITVLSSKSRAELTSAAGKEKAKKELIESINKEFAQRGQEGFAREAYFTYLAVQ
jgi:flagellar FliL protein